MRVWVKDDLDHSNKFIETMAISSVGILKKRFVMVNPAFDNLFQLHAVIAFYCG